MDDVDAADKWAPYYDRLHAMTDSERKDLDGVCNGLDAYLSMHRHETRGGRILPNRIIALACIDLARQWEDDMWARE